REARRVERSREAEVGEPHLAAPGDEDVRGLHVAVDDAARVRRLERGRDGGEDAHRLDDREAPVLGEEVGERLPEDELHGEERDAERVVRLERSERADDAGVLDAREELALALEALARVLRDPGAERQDLERDARAARAVLGDVDLAHAAAADEAEDLEAAEVAPGADPAHGAAIP